MIATNLDCSSTGGTADLTMDYMELELHYVATLEYEERRQLQVENCMLLQERKGARLDKVSMRIMYWPVPRRRNKAMQQVIVKRPLVVLAGFMSRSRGLHWDRKRRD